MASNVILLISSLLGAILSGILIEHHVSPATDSEFMRSVCGTGPEAGCDAVNTSEASRFLGIPIALWGFLYYAMVSSLSIFYWRLKEIAFMQIIFWISAVALLVDISLFVYSLAIIEKICNLCVLTYFLTLGVLSSSIVILKKNKKALLDMDIDFTGFKKKTNILISISFGFIILLGGSIFLYAKSSSSSISGSNSNPDSILNEAWEAFKKQYENSPKKEFSIDHSAWRGTTEPILTIVEFADFLCSHCKHTGEELKQITKKYPKTVKVVFKHYPLDQECNKNITRKFHEGACRLAYISQCALKQRVSAFWQTHDTIFQFQERIISAGSLTEREMDSIIRSSGLHAQAIRSCIANPRIKAQIVQDIEEGDKAGVTGTPSIYINGRRVASSNIDFFIKKLLTYQIKSGIE